VHHTLLQKALLDLKCDRAIIAKIHPLDLSNLDELVFTTIFEECGPGIFSVSNYVKNISANILNLEFKGDKNLVVIANRNSVFNTKCIDHLDKLGMDIIINQLLYTNNYTWGILSFQYLKPPSFLENNILTLSYLKIIQNYKFTLNNVFLTHE
jgi:hypothetical protein